MQVTPNELARRYARYLRRYGKRKAIHEYLKLSGLKTETPNHVGSAVMIGIKRGWIERVGTAYNNGENAHGSDGGVYRAGEVVPV